ncbi:hypothetical protein ACIPC1_02470 [Streptomyces sp. NPDC087263]|uniref:hypothetical protein n=1 Tax=Streptomyces sp. NPDC087263 TaxID=3365773 RepID=UPI0038295F29
MLRRLHFPVIALLLLTVGCSMSTGQDDANGQLLDIPEPTALARSLVLPFDAYQLSDGETHATYQGRDALIRDCMKKDGRSWATIRMPTDVASWRNRLHFGVIEPEVARRFGYHTPAELLSSPVVRKVTAEMKIREAGLDSDSTKALQKCQASAKKTLTHNAMYSFVKFNEFKSETYSAAQLDPTVLKGIQAWSACMRTKGMDYPTPSSAKKDAKWYTEDTDKASRAEIATATADVECKSQVSLVVVMFAAEKKLEEQAIQADLAYFKGLKDANRRYVANARAVLAQS